MKATLREHRAALILTSLTILLPLPAVSLARGALFWPPLVQLALHWAGVLWTLRDWQRRPQSPAALGIVLWIMPTVSLLSASVFSLAASGAGGAEAVMTVLFFGFGLLFLCLGNYLPKIRQNRTLGIKVRWALESEENWNATHRFGGKVWMACGVLSMACGLLPLGAATVVFTAALLAAAAAPCLYSWQYYRRQLREGTAVRLPRRPGAALLTLGMTAAAAGFVAWALLSGSMEVVYGDASFTVDSSWQDLTIAYGDVDSVAYEPQDPSGALSDVRTNGFGNLRLSMGAFHNDLYGDYTRYTWSACDACVVLRVDGETVVLNGRDEDATRAIYDALRERTGRG